VILFPIPPQNCDSILRQPDYQMVAIVATEAGYLRDLWKIKFLYQLEVLIIDVLFTDQTTPMTHGHLILQRKYRPQLEYNLSLGTFVRILDRP